MQIILGIVFIFLLSLILSKNDTLTKKNRNIIVTLLVMIVALAIVYEFILSKVEEKNRTLINTFNQGKTLICNHAEVNQSNYILETGTLSFIAKEDKKEIIGTIYSIEDCKLQE